MWVAANDWEYRQYRHTFTDDADLLAQENASLVCDGLDTIADVYRNGTYLGHAENMFRRWKWIRRSRSGTQPDQQVGKHNTFQRVQDDVGFTNAFSRTQAYCMETASTRGRYSGCSVFDHNALVRS
jgi:glycosyl hydrolase family 2